eukprot:scaffold22682_cov57-Phaeocystis_antarctica.AAC.2
MYLSVYLSIHPSIHPSIHLPLSIYLPGDPCAAEGHRLASRQTDQSRHPRHTTARLMRRYSPQARAAARRLWADAPAAQRGGAAAARLAGLH